MCPHHYHPIQYAESVAAPVSGRGHSDWLGSLANHCTRREIDPSATSYHKHLYIDINIKSSWSGRNCEKIMDIVGEEQHHQHRRKCGRETAFNSGKVLWFLVLRENGI